MFGRKRLPSFSGALGFQDMICAWLLNPSFGVAVSLTFLLYGPLFSNSGLYQKHPGSVKNTNAWASTFHDRTCLFVKSEVVCVCLNPQVLLTHSSVWELPSLTLNGRGFQKTGW